MAFLDNSGDIILDAVLTDTGRQRMAQGTFRITKFALGDEEIDYGLFNSNHPSGSAFYDLRVMQTPVLEAFTNNTSLMKSKLVTMTRNNILYLPMLKLNNVEETKTIDANANFNFQGYIMLADLNTERNGKALAFPLRKGLIRGASQTMLGGDKTNHIAIDQGINSSDGGISFRQSMPADLVETAYLVKMDHRLLRLEIPSRDFLSRSPVTNQFVDDDGIATYYLVLGDGYGAIEGPPPTQSTFQDGRSRDRIVTDEPPVAEAGFAASAFQEVFPGPLGSILRIYPKASHLVRQGRGLFDELGTNADGSSFQIRNKVGAVDDENLGNYQHIDTVISVVGVTTGYAIDIPIRIVKKS